MKKLVTSCIYMFLLVFVFAGTASAVTFDEVALYSTDPTIGDISFSAGDPATPSDTFVDNYISADPYLLSGFEDNTGLGWNSGGDFIAVELNTSDLFDTVTFDLGADFVNPSSGTGFYIFFGDATNTSRIGYLEVVFSLGYQTISYSNTNDYDYFGILSDSTFGVDTSTFYIDNFTYTTKQPGGNNGGAVIPEPSTLVLLGLGLGGLVFLRRKS